jgi:GNAT superfamily N-acetyltransferase
MILKALLKQLRFSRFSVVIFLGLLTTLAFQKTASAHPDDSKSEVHVAGNEQSGRVLVRVKDKIPSEACCELTYRNCHISLLFTYSRYRKQGHATAAMNAALQKMKDCAEISVFASPLDDNMDPATLRKFYGKFGFEPSLYWKFLTFFNSNQGRGTYLYRNNLARNSSITDRNSKNDLQPTPLNPSGFRPDQESRLHQSMSAF